MDSKKLSIILNSIFGAAIIALFVLFFLQRNQIKNNALPQSIVNSGINPSIVYVNIDTLQSKYDMFYDIKAEMDAKQRKFEGELASRSKNYEAGVKDYQDKVSKGLVTRSKAQEMEQQLYGEQQNVLKMREEMSQQLAEEMQTMNRQMLNSVMEYLKEYNSNGRYTYIFSHAFGSSILYANDSLDITNEVIKGLNEKYAKTRKKPVK